MKQFIKKYIVKLKTMNSSFFYNYNLLKHILTNYIVYDIISYIKKEFNNIINDEIKFEKH